MQNLELYYVQTRTGMKSVHIDCLDEKCCLPHHRDAQELALEQLCDLWNAQASMPLTRSSPVTAEAASAGILNTRNTSSMIS